MENQNNQIDRIRRIAQGYYRRKDIQEILARQAQHREFVPRYFESFGKRPDSVEYASDILSYVEKGATSFHVSEELWQDPLELGTSLNQEQLNKLRAGWDLILDIDCKFLEFSKIAAFLLCEALFFHGIRNLGLKYSGSSGFHISISHEAFPEQVNEVLVKNFFPEGPRIVAAYLKEMIEEPLRGRLLELSDTKDMAIAIGKPEKLMYKTVEKERGNFVQVFNPFSVLEIDTILISSRHLYRAAYSLHEKTGLASCVIKPQDLKAFHPGWAKPERVLPQLFLKKAEKNEAKELLIQALDWSTRKKEKIRQDKAVEERIVEREIEQIESKTPFVSSGKSREKIKIENVSKEILPPCINKILEGMKHDGRKRALFILINFFRNLGLEFEDIEKRLEEWNKKNYKPLREGYVRTQLSWFKRQESRLPPNCNLQAYYQDIGVCMPDALCKRIKNPVNYTVIKARAMKQGMKRKR